MASIITATTTSGLTHSADNSGVLQLASGTGNLVTVPSVTGTAMVSGNMPAFSAYNGSAQSLTGGSFTKLQFPTEEFDTNSNFDNATNYRFTPTVAGYYQVSAGCSIGSVVANNYFLISIYKNGARFKDGTNFPTSSAAGDNTLVSALVYFNGSTDYAEIYVINNNTANTASGSNSVYFQASMVRGA